jgi:peptidoglycan L-alanyl-D-glutamate endopeptidase CwlK
MPSFSGTSKKRLSTCDEKLQTLFNEVVKHFDCSVLCGHREEEEQNKAYKAGNSQKQFPHGKHNKLPSNAVDVAPYPIDWDDRERFQYFAGFVLGTAKQLGIDIRYGGDWDGDNDLKDNEFDDLVHFEIKG